jgi:DinB superfamily
MKQLVRSILLLAPLALLVLTGTVRAQGAPPQEKPMTPSAAVLDNWSDVGKRLVNMAEDWSEYKYDYRMKPEMRTFQQVILHIAGSNYDMLNRITKSKAGDARNDPPVSEYKTKAETVAFLKKSIADGEAQIHRAGDAGVLAHLDDWIGFTEHMGEHYGLLVAYYRANGIVPPESRPKK